MLECENAFYEAHQAEFMEKYPDKWLVITGESLWGVYDKISDAAKAAFEHLEPGKIMIHKPSDDEKVIEIPSVRARYPKSSKKPKLRPEMAFSGDCLLKIPYPY